MAQQWQQHQQQHQQPTATSSNMAPWPHKGPVDPKGEDEEEEEE